MSSPCYIVTLPAQPFCMGYPEELCWTWFDILIYASTTQKVICSFELSLFSCLLTFVYQLIVKSMHAFVHRCLLFLWSVKPFYPERLGETNSRTSSISRIGSKQLCSADQVAIQLLVCSTLECCPLYVKNIIGIVPSLMNSWCSDSSHHHHSFLGHRVVVTGMPTSESWCVKSILRATRCLVVNGQYSHS